MINVGWVLTQQKLYILCNFERIQRIRQWPSVSKPPVPIPNTVVKTHNGDNTWRATSWEDSSLLASNLNKKEIDWTIGFFFLYVVLDYLQFTTFTLRLCFSHEKQHSIRLFTGTSFAYASLLQKSANHPPSQENVTFSHLFLRQSHPVLGFCFTLCSRSLHFCSRKKFRSLRSVLLRRSVRLHFTSAYAKSATRS